MNPLFLAGMILLAGSLGGAVAVRCKCPRITGYLVVGMLFSPSLFNLVSEATLESMKVFNTLALGLIALEIGASLRTDSLRSSGRSLFWITTLQALFPWLISTALIALLSPWMVDIPNSTFRTVYLPLGLLLGAMACPTAPAVTVALVHECRARGPITTLLFAVVALTDAIAIIAYAVASGISRHLVNSDGGMSLRPMIVDPFLEIAASMGIGLAMAIVLLCLSRFFRTRALQMVVVVGISLLCTGICEALDVSTLLANMSIGFVTVNWGAGDGLPEILEDMEGVVFTGFFVTSGFYFDLKAMQAAGWMTLVIILGRCSGKYLGAWVGAVVGGAGETVRKYFGVALLPKAGLVIGLAITAKESFPALGSILFNGMLASVIVNTLFTPPLAKVALRKTGECGT